MCIRDRFRFAKLMRILRATRIFARWEKTLVLRMPYGAIRLIKFVVIFIAVVHWLGCVFYFVQVRRRCERQKHTQTIRVRPREMNVWLTIGCVPC